MAKSIPELTAEQAADAIVQGVEQNKREIVIPSMLRLPLILHTIMLRTIEHRLWRSAWKRPI
jgi:short-subunit dehydrogenase